MVGKTTILQLTAVIKYCSVYVTSDSAPLHIAAAMKVPVVALFGPTDPMRHLPPADKLKVMRKELPCSPCYGTKCKLGTRICMNDITAYEVYLEVKKFML
jgi:ADP-heptose:LPS heptosyltransferase